MTFGERLKKLRKEQGFTQDELADKLYVTRTAISKWETDRGFPNIDSLKQIATIFNMSVDELLAEEDIRNQKQQVEKVSKKLNKVAMVSYCLAALFVVLSLFIREWYIIVPLILCWLVGFVFSSFEKHDIQGMDKKKIIMNILIRVILFVLVISIVLLITMLPYNCNP